MELKLLAFLAFSVWSFPVWKYRSDFRKMVYQTTDWKINIQPYFWWEIKVLMGLDRRTDPADRKLISFYRRYLVVYLALVLLILFT